MLLQWHWSLGADGSPNENRMKPITPRLIKNSDSLRRLGESENKTKNNTVSSSHILHLQSLGQWFLVFFFFLLVTDLIVNLLKNGYIHNCGYNFQGLWVLIGQPWMLETMYSWGQGPHFHLSIPARSTAPSSIRQQSWRMRMCVRSQVTTRNNLTG